MTEKTRFFILLGILLCSVILAVFLFVYTNNAALSNFGG